MAGSGVHGPTLTYVTDPALEMSEQQRVVGRIIRCASDHRLRVAVRLPDATDHEVSGLLEWYWNEEVKLRPLNRLQPPLLHYRPGMPKSVEEAQIWMPSRFLGTGIDATAYSVHNRLEVERAVECGASEVIFGHVFNTASHPNEEGRGIHELLDARESTIDEPGITFTAIGGINEGSMYAVGTAGIMSVACIRAISRSPDITKTLWNMHQEWTRGLNASLEKGQQQ